MSEREGSKDMGVNPMEMMQRMMKGMMGEGFSPMEMCRQMTLAVERASEMAAYGTPELRGLFEDWLKQVEGEILEFVEKEGKVDAQEVADKFKISLESSAFILSKLAREGKLNLSAGAHKG